MLGEEFRGSIGKSSSLQSFGLWYARKKLIFEGRRLEIDDILEHVQILSWKWFHFRLVGFGYSISDWCQCSVAFLGVWNSGLYSRAS